MRRLYVLGLLVAALAWVAPHLEGVGDAAARVVVTDLTVQKFPGPRLGPSRQGVLVLYPPGDKADAELVLALADRDLPRLERDLGTRPARPVVVEIEANGAAMAHDLFRGSFESAVGAYYLGVVHILAPEAWISAPSQAARADVFRRDGPLPHELTHLLLDEETDGNYPAWYTEGLAQWEEARLTGYVWREPDNDLLANDWYTASDLDRFYALPNQALAYREALALVSELARRGGPSSLAALDRDLARGEPFAEVLHERYGLTMSGLVAAAHRDVLANPDEWRSPQGS